MLEVLGKRLSVDEIVHFPRNITKDQFIRSHSYPYLMRAIDVLKLYMESEEYRIEVDSIDPDSLLELVEVPLEAQVIINNGIRRRLVFLAFLKIVYDCDPEFVRDYLNLQHSLEEIHKKNMEYILSSNM